MILKKNNELVLNRKLFKIYKFNNMIYKIIIIWLGKL